MGKGEEDVISQGLRSPGCPGTGLVADGTDCSGMGDRDMWRNVIGEITRSELLKRAR